MDKIRVGRIPVDLFTEESLHREISRIIDEGSKKTILHANAHLVQMANSTEPWLIEYYNSEVDHVMCDGSGIQLGASLTGQPVPEKISYNIWFWHFAEFCAAKGYSIFLLGATEEVSKKAAANLKGRNPALKISYHHGYFDRSSGSAENTQVLEQISQEKPNILLVCFGMPLQERYVKENFGKLNTNVILTGGGALDFFSGKSKTAPRLYRRLYLEWFYRMAADPKRLWRRYMIGNFKFLYYVLKYRNVR